MAGMTVDYNDPQYDAPINQRIQNERFSSGSASTPGMVAAQGIEAMGKGMEAAGAAGMREWAAQQDQLAEANVKGKVAALQDGISAALHDPNTGYLWTRGADAQGRYSDTFGALAQLPAQMADGLNSPIEKQMWQEQSTRLVQGALDQVRQHAGSQLKETNAQASDALVKSSTNAAVSGAAAWNVPNSSFWGNLNTVYGQAEQSAKLRFGDSADPAVIGGFAKSAYTGALGDVVANLVQMGRGTDAQAMIQQLDPNKVDATAFTRIKEIAQNGDVLQQAQQAGDLIFMKHPDDFAGAMADVQAITNPKVREQAETQVKDHFNNANTAISQQQNGANTAIMSAYMSGSRYSDIQKTPDWQNASPEAQRRVEEWVHSDAMHAQQMSQTDKMNEMVGFQTLVQMRQNNPQAFSGMDVVKNANNLGIKSPGMVKQLIEMQGAVSKSDALEASLNAAYKNAATIYKPLLIQTGISPLPTDQGSAKTTKEQSVAQFESTVQGDIQTWMRQHNGQIPAQSDLQGIVKSNLLPVFVHGTSTLNSLTGGLLGSDTKKPMYQLTPDEMPKAYVISEDGGESGFDLGNG